MTQLSVIVPIKDERDNLGPLHERLRQALDPLSLEYEILFVDDGSTDGSFEVLQGLAAADARVKVLKTEPPPGRQKGIMVKDVNELFGELRKRGLV